MTNSRSITIPIILIALIIGGAALHTMQPVLLPFVVALFLANIFRPVVGYLRHRHIPMGVALVVVMIIVGAFLVGVGAVAVSSVQSLLKAMPRYELRWNNTILPGLSHLLESAPQVIQDQVNTLKWSNLVQVSSIITMIYAGAGGFVNVLSGTALILLFMLFILGGHGLFEKKIRMAYPEHADNLADLIQRIDAKTEKYFQTVTVVNLASGIITAGILMVFGVDLALLWGLFTFLINFIPTIGSIIALVLPISVALLQFDGLGTPLAVACTLVPIQFLWSSVVTPRIMGYSLDLSPLLVLLSLIFWGWVWGPWGMIFSVPMTSMIKIALESVDATKPVAVLMSSGGTKKSGMH